MYVCYHCGIGLRCVSRAVVKETRMTSTDVKRLKELCDNLAQNDQIGCDRPFGHWLRTGVHYIAISP